MGSFSTKKSNALGLEITPIFFYLSKDFSLLICMNEIFYVNFQIPDLFALCDVIYFVQLQIILGFYLLMLNYFLNFYALN